MIFILPYIFLLVSRINHIRQATVICILSGFLAGYGFSMKPHYILVFIGLEIYLLLKMGWGSFIRTENITTTITILLMVLFIFVFTPEYIKILKFCLSFYDGMNMGFWEMTTRNLPSIAFFFLIFMAVKMDSELKETGWVFFVSSLLFTIAGLLQHKGWSYHFYPAVSSASLLFMVVVLSFRKRSKEPLSKLVILFSILFLLFKPVNDMTKYFHWLITDGKQGITGVFIDIVKKYAGGEGFALISTKVGPAFPVVNYTREKWALRYPDLWPLPGFYGKQDLDRKGNIVYHDLTNRTPEETDFINNIVEDLENNIPKIIFVEDDKDKLGFSNRGLNFDYLEYFLKNDRFASVWEKYMFLGDMSYPAGSFSVWISI
jgi:hypothetical protein